MSATPSSTLLSGYRPLQGHHDEMVDAGGGVTGSWRYLADALDALGPDALRQRREQVRRILRERGVTYNVYGDPHGLQRTWDLDPVPVLIDSAEWGRVEHGLQQRAELLNRVLQDLYGDQELLTRGLLPAELVHGHDGFLRPCHPYRTDLAHPLTLYAADLARGPDGTVRVIGDRTQSPSGAGYALENRVVMARTLPSLFRESHVHRLALFFQNLRATLSGLAPGRDRDDPHVVVLTPGPLNETYFEHAFLASYLGYTLVEGGDLTVRDGRVWLRSMGRLEPVDVILRRLDDDYCDALELRPDSLLGVPGLTEVARRGRVAIANPLGAGILENPALHAFLPGIARHLLGQELALPGLPTWWCGDPESCEQVLARLETLVIKPIDRRAGEPAVFPGTLDAAGRDALIARIRQAPHRYVGQEQGRFSSVPTLGEPGLEPRLAVLRTFLVGRPDGYAVMPGGLTRVTGHPNDASVSNQAGGLSKDTWVIASEPVREAALLTPEVTEDGPTDRSAALPPAATENLFWMARYAERAEQSLRLLRIILRLRASDVGAGTGAPLRQLLAGLAAISGQAGDTLRRDPADDALVALLQDDSRTGTVAFNFNAMMAASHAVRDRLAPDTWRVIGTIRRRLAELPSPLPVDDLPAILDELITLLAAFRGLQEDTMVHSRSWSFLETGRCLERGLLTSAFLRAVMVTPLDTPDEPRLLDAVLEHLESLNAYHREHHRQPRPETVLQLVLSSETNPRAVGFQLARLESRLASLPAAGAPDRLSAHQRPVLDARTSLRLSDPEALLPGDGGRRDALDSLLRRTADRLGQAARALAAAYFTDPQGPRQLDPVGDRGGEQT
ncbi:circularly permuted type 2 ATP-grasp protein [Aquisalimonas sp.]|uniref:circularly permuted type 2 ATP-grasp protein n=1 Tax=unclassified Aquisalimonas TaxID=2644645 RepID=UPI0025C5EC0D|nr:circularly permuted type 2 ATP-grasp protein [Aquisalimonas sp.]